MEPVGDLAKPFFGVPALAASTRFVSGAAAGAGTGGGAVRILGGAETTFVSSAGRAGEDALVDASGGAASVAFVGPAAGADATDGVTGLVTGGVEVTAAIVFVGGAGVGLAGIAGTGLAVGDEPVSTFVPTIMSGGAVGGGDGGGAGFCGAAAGDAGGGGSGGKSGSLTMPGGKFIVQPTYWPSCERNTMTSG